MKTVVLLGVVFAVLLLVSGVSFALDGQIFCKCYDITATNVDDPQDIQSGPVTICADIADMSGAACTDIGQAEFHLFYDKEFNSVNALASIDNTGLCLGAFGFRFRYKYILGIGYCDSKRWTLKGHQADDCSPCMLIID
jgi:hypothetical protein